ncbi:MAG: alpha-glucan family phosphorylase [Planctomycetota bacterium]
MLNPNHATIRRFDIQPEVPEVLQPLRDLAYNLWWSWHPEAIDLFIRLDRVLWRKTRHNPVLMLSLVSPERLHELSSDRPFLDALNATYEKLQRHRRRPGWLKEAHDDKLCGGATLAYFCAEFAITESLQIYSGGLGVLAGDHLKSASELGLPLIAVGLLYRHGYFQQYLTPDGWQQEYTPDLDFEHLPISRVLGDDGEQVTVRVKMPKGPVSIALWQATVGRVPLYLLDTDLPENRPEDRAITGQLYGGDMDMRIRQEIVLGIGGTRALKRIGITPDVCHMNEGHSAFLALERIRNLIDEHGLTFDEARQAAMASHVFTTHTPVPAGIDRFPPELVQQYFAEYHALLKLDMEGFLALGRDDVFNKDEPFSMATLAIRTSDWCNGVSKLHGEVSRSMWKGIWPGIPDEEIPIGHVTNGVHASSWLSRPLAEAIDRQLGTSTRHTQPADHEVFQAVAGLPDDHLWAIHTERRHRLVSFTKRDDPARPARLGAARHADNDLDPEALTIGFARRFATYKRGNLMLRDPERLIRLITDKDRPVQFVVSGKAHPADGGGKDLIKQIVQFTRHHGLGGKIVFIENYAMHSARYLVQGCDVWLNNPRRGMEASGTSGMKAAINGVPNCSILDGWWDEGYTPDVGWAIGYRETYDNPDIADQIESKAFYDLLEKQIVPMFYERDNRGIPQRWVQVMKQSIIQLAPFFNTNRMVQQYAEQYYLPALQRARALRADGLAGSVLRAQQKDRLRYAWPSLSFVNVKTNAGRPLSPDQKIEVAADVQLGGLPTQDVKVQALIGVIGEQGGLSEPTVVDLEHFGEEGEGVHRYAVKIEPPACGPHGVALRVVPGGELMDGVHEPGLIFWDGQPAAQAAKETPATTPERA